LVAFLYDGFLLVLYLLFGRVTRNNKSLLTKIIAICESTLKNNDCGTVPTTHHWQRPRNVYQRRQLSHFIGYASTWMFL